MSLKNTALAAALALAAAATGCGEQDRTTGPTAANPTVPPATPSAPTVSSSSAPASTSSSPTAGLAPQPPAGAAPTAQDSTALRPQQELTKSEEAYSMPKSGQVNNYNSPAYEPKQGAGGD
jgi:hypothetical protein